MGQSCSQHSSHFDCLGLHPGETTQDDSIERSRDSKSEKKEKYRKIFMQRSRLRVGRSQSEGNYAYNLVEESCGEEKMEEAMKLDYFDFTSF